MIVIDQGITNHTNFNPKNVQKTCPFKATYLLRVYQHTVWQVVKGGKVVIIDQVIKFNPDIRTSKFKGNLALEYHIKNGTI